MNIQVYDNGGETFDRYTVIIDNDVFGMSENPLSASGFNQWCGDAYQLQTPHDYLGKDVTQEIFKDEIMVKAIVQRINQ